MTQKGARMPSLTSASGSNDYEAMMESAHRASELLKALSHETRLIILCMLAEGEKSVSDLESLLAMRQPTVSQQLARLRADRLVQTRRDGKTIYYSLVSSEARQIIELMYHLYCRPAAD
jgi:ArsR family transcriptional regulator, virulence genes transcriptional regulator